MNWKIHLKGFKSFLALEKSLTKNSIQAYLRDVEKLMQYFEIKEKYPGCIPAIDRAQRESIDKYLGIE